MAEEQGLQVLKLANRVVGSSRRLLTFQTTDANADMSRKNHIDIVGTVTDCEGCDLLLLLNILLAH